MAPGKKAFSQVRAPKRAQGNSKLLALPAEIRNKIYELVLCNQTVSISDGPKNHANAPALILTCRQTHAEALSIYYSTAIFETSRVETLESWFRKIGSVREKWIQHCHVHVTGTYWTRQGLIDMANLAEDKKDWIAGRTYVEPEMIEYCLYRNADYHFCATSPVKDLRAFMTYKSLRAAGKQVGGMEKARVSVSASINCSA